MKRDRRHLKNRDGEGYACVEELANGHKLYRHGDMFIVAKDGLAVYDIPYSDLETFRKMFPRMFREVKA